MTVDIIILNYNGRKFTEACINSLLQNTDADYHILLYDNASSEPGTEEFLYKMDKEEKVTVFRRDYPDSGFAEGNNYCLKHSSADYICLLNNDILIPPNKTWLKKLLSHFEDPEVGLVGCKLVYPNDTIQFAGGFLVKQAFSTMNCFYHRGRFEPMDKYSVVEAVPQITFALVLARRKEFGYLDEEYKLGTFEDNDKCMEYIKKGYKLIYDGEVYLYHYESATTLKRDPKQWTAQQMANAMLFRKRWLPYLWIEVNKNPEFWGWTREDLIRETERMKKEGVYYNAKISYNDWISIVEKVEEVDRRLSSNWNS